MNSPGDIRQSLVVGYHQGRNLLKLLGFPVDAEFFLGYVASEELAQRCRRALMKSSDRVYLKGDEGTRSKFLISRGFTVHIPGVPAGYYEQCIRWLLFLAEQHPDSEIHFG